MTKKFIFLFSLVGFFASNLLGTTALAGNCPNARCPSGDTNPPSFDEKYPNLYCCGYYMGNSDEGCDSEILYTIYNCNGTTTGRSGCDSCPWTDEIQRTLKQPKKAIKARRG